MSNPPGKYIFETMSLTMTGEDFRIAIEAAKADERREIIKELTAQEQTLVDRFTPEGLAKLGEHYNGLIAGLRKAITVVEGARR